MGDGGRDIVGVGDVGGGDAAVWGGDRGLGVQIEVWGLEMWL